MNRFEQQLKSEGVDVNGVTSLMEEMSRRNRELFSLPPYVLYVSRAFSTLEGIGLSVDEDYSILQECYPYLAKRLMTDDSPRAANSLKTMLFGKGQFSATKMLEMANNFQEYTVSTQSTIVDSKQAKEAQNVFINLLITPQGSPVQNLLVEGAAAVSDAIVREGFHLVKESQAGKITKTLLKTPSDFASSLPAQLRPFALPLLLPYEVAKAANHVLQKDENDEASIASIKSLLDLTLSRDNNEQALPTVVPSSFLTPETLRPLADPNVLRQVPGVVSNLSRRFGMQLLTRATERLESTHNKYKSSSKDEKIDAARITTVVTDQLVSQAKNMKSFLKGIEPANVV